MPDLPDRLRALGLLAASASLDDLIALATKKRWGITEILEHVADLEEKDRTRRGLERRMSRSRLEKFKPMADFDWNWPTAIDRPLVESLLSLDFLGAARNVVFVANGGLGNLRRESINSACRAMVVRYLGSDRGDEFRRLYGSTRARPRPLRPRRPLETRSGAGFSCRSRLGDVISDPMSNLQTSLNQLASQFASSVLDAIRRASLEELLGEPKANVPANGSAARTAAPKSRASGRLPRRSAEDIAKALEQVVGLVKKNTNGLRAEEIRKKLGLQAKEMPRILQQGLATKALKSKGQKRATTYFPR